MLVQEIGFEEYINFQKTLVELLRENLKNYPVTCNYPEVSQKIMKERLSCGLPVLSLEWLKMCLDHAIMEDFLEKILLVIKKHKLLNDVNQNKLELMRNTISSLPEKLVFTYLKNYSGFFLELNNKIKRVVMDVTSVIADILSKHVVLDIIRGVPRIEDCIKWKGDYCPFCGGEPYILIICEELKRMKLRCRICYTCWDFDEKKCPFCKNEDEKYLQTFYEVEHSQFFLLLCKNCKRYIKAMKERDNNWENDEEDVFLTDARTIALDSFAHSNGYRGKEIKSDFNLLIENYPFSEEKLGGER